MEGEGLFGKEKVSTHGIQQTSMQREGGGKRALTSPSLSLSLKRLNLFIHSSHSFLATTLRLSLSQDATQNMLRFINL